VRLLQKITAIYLDLL